MFFQGVRQFELGFFSSQPPRPWFKSWCDVFSSITNASIPGILKSTQNISTLSVFDGAGFCASTVQTHSAAAT